MRDEISTRRVLSIGIKLEDLVFVVTYRFFAGTNIFVEQFRTLHGDKIKATLLGNSRCQQRLATPWIAVQQQPKTRLVIENQVEGLSIKE